MDARGEQNQKSLRSTAIEHHKLCMDNSVQRCKYKKQLTYSDQSFSTQTKDNKLPASFLSYILPLYTRLSDEDLLKRCVAGPTQNQNESFNATIWKRCPKERNFDTAAVQRALRLAILSWNVGCQGLVQVLLKLS